MIILMWGFTIVWGNTTVEMGLGMRTHVFEVEVQGLNNPCRKKNSRTA